MGGRIKYKIDDQEFAIGVTSVNGMTGDVITGEPDIKYDSIVFCKELEVIWTHNKIFNCNDGTQSDWNVTDEDAKDFIKNKPTKLSDFIDDTHISLTYAEYLDLKEKGLIETDKYYEITDLSDNLLPDGEGSSIDVTKFATKEEVEVKADKTEIPTKISQLENDLNFNTTNIVVMTDEEYRAITPDENTFYFITDRTN